jgi:tetratricopeptide (TPR) repeat protein
MSGSKADKGFVAALIIFFGICGFLGVFLWTKLYMGDLLNRSEAEELRKKDQEQQATIDLLKQKARADAERTMKQADSPDELDAAGQTQIRVAAQFVEADSKGQKNAEDLYLLAYSQYQAGNYEAAVETAKKGLAANPEKKFVWSFYNLLGLAYHWEMPSNWKDGDTTEWFDRAKENYEKARDNTSDLNEKQIAECNLCFLYLDAQKNTECDQLAQNILDNKAYQTVDGEIISDLARIAYAASRIMKNDNGKAVELLNQTKNLAKFTYLFNPDDLPQKVLDTILTLDLKPEILAVLKQTLKA